MIAAPPSARLASVAPAAAVELDLAPSTFLGFLAELEEARMVVRGGGLTLFRQTRFGEFGDAPGDDGGLRRDDLSGLSLDPGRLRRVCLLHGGGLPPAFEIELAGCGFALAVWPGQGRGDLAATRDLLASSGTSALAYEAVRRAGAAAWLDELGTEDAPSWSNRLVFDRDAGTISVVIASAALVVSSRFRGSGAGRSGVTAIAA